jgi:hypothetical protein
MANEGFLELTPLTVDAQPAADPATLVEFERTADGQTIGKATVSFPPSRLFRLPAFPQEKATACFISPQRYRGRWVGVFTLTDGETITRQPTVFRNPKEWSADFVKWNDLGTPFQALKDVLGQSPDLHVKGGKVFESFTGDRYDGVLQTDRVTLYAKASLLNLFAKLNSLKEPLHNRKPWFGFVTQLLVIGRERLIAIVDDDMIERVDQISRDIGQFEDYERTPAGNHYPNIPAGYTVKKSSMISVKTDDEKGNVQLTLSPAIGPAGEAVTLLDADIDENGKLMAHLADLFKHKFTGGTHPFDIHEYLLLEDKLRPLGYQLI